MDTFAAEVGSLAHRRVPSRLKVTCEMVLSIQSHCEHHGDGSQFQSRRLSPSVALGKCLRR